MLTKLKNIFKKKPHKLKCQWCDREIFIDEDIIAYKTGRVFDDDVVECIVVHKHCERYLPELIKMLGDDKK